MAKTLSAFKGYGGIYDLNEQGMYKVKIYVFGYLFEEIDSFTVCREDTIQQDFESYIASRHNMDPTENPYRGSLVPLNSIDINSLKPKAA